MILINEITESQFRLYDFKFVIGDYATYNSYFKIVLETSEIIGLQTVTGGIKPSAEIFNNKLILIAGNNFYIYDLDGKIIRQFTSDCIFYEFIIYKNNILVVSELSIFLLNYDFVKIWSYATRNSRVASCLCGGRGNNLHCGTPFLCRGKRLCACKGTERTRQSSSQ